MHVLLTAQLGLLRSLTAGEIVEQIVIALNDAYGVGPNHLAVRTS